MMAINGEAVDSRLPKPTMVYRMQEEKENTCARPLLLMEKEPWLRTAGRTSPRDKGGPYSVKKKRRVHHNGGEQEADPLKNG